MKKYTLTLRFTFRQSDDPGARGIANMIRNAFRGVSFTPTFKLQEVFDNKPPRKVHLP